MSAIDWAYWLPRLSWFGVGCLVAFALVPLVLMWAEEQERRAYNRGWGDGYRTAWALTRGDDSMPYAGYLRVPFRGAEIVPGSVGCECRLTKEERER